MANEKRLIDANALKSQITRYHMSLTPRYISKLVDAEIGDVIDIIDETPTVDAVEVVHGEWIVLAEFFDGSICAQCPVCGEEYTYKKGRLELIGVEYAKYNYCPNCGMKMDGDGNG